MKVGLRTPSVTKSIKARTTGRVNRTLKKSVNPLYGKKGMGLINNPSKAIYNKVYNKTTTSAFNGTNKFSKVESFDYSTNQASGSGIGKKIAYIISFVLVVIGIVCMVQGFTQDLSLSSIGLNILALFLIVAGITIFYITRKI